VTGEGGQDTLFGGAGSDLFNFFIVTDSTTFAPDVIRDFSDDETDRISLQNVYAGTLTFLGYAAFNDTVGQVRVEHTGTTDTVHIDIDGNNISDMDITVVTATDLIEGDFFL
jgi:Ca2+-binding RTX toxin-like protein